MPKDILKNDWNDIIGEEFEKPYYVKLRSFLKNEYTRTTIYPHMNDIFNALHYTSYQNTKVVILGQDPYHGPQQAHGLSFSVQKGVDVPPSLRNMYKELNDDLGCPIPTHGSLVQWAKEGVLLLNTSLTVRQGQAASHRGQGWEFFTDAIINVLNERDTPVIFLLWGSHAREKRKLLDLTKHQVFEAPHPSPLSAHRGFFGSKPFSKSNAALEQFGLTPINWCISD
ncbi:uracil-DNA glycosylase [Aureibacillus halotolerans]|uniref:Uracil-DNA glycosylase n=1 Tax=Aureibacillus halotolerans TaxID=1508390 RepID=A0A4V3D5U9_9BACI|nr:uracil-DNA glycosylase [Aureibacillus halotolerans]TDQ41437.1 uracil-DNA glycosylase [Aureibacillus halotolerans]